MAVATNNNPEQEEAVMNSVALWRSMALSLALALLASCGGGGTSGSAEPTSAASTPSPTLPPAGATRDGSAALALYDAPQAYLYMATGPVMWSDAGRPLSASWKDGPCVSGSGTVSTVLDGSMPPAPLPTGNHTLSTTFLNCMVDGLAGITFNGTARLVYSAPDWSSVTAELMLASMRATGSVRANMDDVTGHGSATWSRTITGTSYVERYSPAAGSTLTNNRTTRTITFQGGTISNEVDNTVFPPVSQSTYADVAVELNGARYLLNGALRMKYVFDLPEWSGEVRITANGVPVARVYGDSRIRAETFEPIQTF